MPFDDNNVNGFNSLYKRQTKKLDQKQHLYVLDSERIENDNPTVVTQKQVGRSSYTYTQQTRL